MPKVTRQSSIILDGETISHVFFQCFENVSQNESLDRKFGSRKQWNFKSGETKFFSSKVVDRKRAEVSRLAFMNS